MTTDERVKEIREAATQSAQNHPWVEYVTFLLTELDAARAREQAWQAWANRAEAREAKLREKAQVVCNFTGDDGSTEYFVEWLRAMNDLRAALTEGDTRG